MLNKIVYLDYVDGPNFEDRITD